MRAPLSRKAIVDAAWRILMDEGLDAVSLRHVAGALDVTAPALYAHIRDKEDLLAAVAELEFENLLGRYRDRSFDDPVEELRYELRQYVEYARERPRAFHLLFRYRSSETGEPTTFPEHPKASETFFEALKPTEAAIEAGIFRQVEPLTAGLSIWAAIHGLATVLLTGYDFGEHEEPMIEATIDLIIEGMRAG